MKPSNERGCALKALSWRNPSKLLRQYWPVETRHLTGAAMALKASNYDTLPLCAMHHRTGGFGVAIHAGQKTWEKKFGYQRDFTNG
jgi:hypothetical protein